MITFRIESAPEIGPSLEGSDQHRSDHVPVLVDQHLHRSGIVQVSLTVEAEVEVAFDLDAKLEAQVSSRVLRQLGLRPDRLHRVVLGRRARWNFFEGL